jgi:hypothetical protein
MTRMHAVVAEVYRGGEGRRVSRAEFPALVRSAVRRGDWAALPLLPRAYMARPVVCEECGGKGYERETTAAGRLRKCRQCCWDGPHQGFDMKRRPMSASEREHSAAHDMTPDGRTLWWRPCSSCEIDPAYGGPNTLLHEWVPWVPDCADCRDTGWVFVRALTSREASAVWSE